MDSWDREVDWIEIVVAVAVAVDDVVVGWVADDDDDVVEDVIAVRMIGVDDCSVVGLDFVVERVGIVDIVGVEVIVDIAPLQDWLQLCGTLYRLSPTRLVFKMTPHIARSDWGVGEPRIHGLSASKRWGGSGDIEKA